MLYDTEIKWCRKVYPGSVVKHDEDEVDAAIAVEDVSHKLVEFLKGVFYGSKLR